MGQLDDQALAKKDQARKKRDEKSKAKSMGSFNFVNVNLKADDKRAIREAQFDPYEFTDQLMVWLESGYKFSIRDNEEKGYYLASLSGVEDRCPNKGYIVTARSSSYEESLIALAYKVKELLPPLWSQLASDTDDTLG